MTMATPPETYHMNELSNAPDRDTESIRGPPEHSLQRKLKNRHIAMISIGGVIGTGLFVGTADSLANGGPVGLLLGYIVMGTVVFCVMVTLGEMVAFLPIAGGHIKLAERFVDPAFSFTMGFSYWYSWVIASPAEISAAILLLDYWDLKVDDSVWVIMCLVVAVTINMLGAGAYGESEFIFASIKVITITGLIILGIVVDLGGGPDHNRIGFRNWKNPGPFVQFDNIPGARGRFLGWWYVIPNAAFSFIGTEIVAIAAGEAKNPRHNLPKAIRRVYIRILLFYIGGSFIIGLLVPSNDKSLLLLKKGTAATSLSADTIAASSHPETAAASPFVIAFGAAGLKSLTSVINACLLTSAWSASSSDLYTSSRAIYGLAASGNAPTIFLKTTRGGLPYVAVIFCASFSLLAFITSAMSSKEEKVKVFKLLSNMTAVAGLMTWFGISVTYLRFYKGLKAQRINRKSFPYSTRLQPYAAWYGAFATIFVCVFSAVFLHLDNSKLDGGTFVTSYIILILWPILYLVARIYYRVKPVAAVDMDFKSDLANIDADSYDEPPPKNKWEAFWQWIM